MSKAARQIGGDGRFLASQWWCRRDTIGSSTVRSRGSTLTPPVAVLDRLVAVRGGAPWHICFGNAPELTASTLRDRSPASGM